MRNPLRIALCALALLLACAAASASAEEGWGYDLADELMSPYCPGRALSECPSPQAEDLRRWILDKEEAGASKSEVEEELYGVYGDQLRQSPKAEGVGLVAYVIPAVLFVAGGGILALFLRRQSAAPAADPPPAPAAPEAVDPELERALEEELRRSESSA